MQLQISAIVAARPCTRELSLWGTFGMYSNSPTDDNVLNGSTKSHPALSIDIETYKRSNDCRLKGSGMWSFGTKFGTKLAQRHTRHTILTGRRTRVGQTFFLSPCLPKSHHQCSPLCIKQANSPIQRLSLYLSTTCLCLRTEYWTQILVRRSFGKTARSARNKSMGE